MPPAGYLKNTCPACTPGTSRTNPLPSYPGCPGPCPNLDSKPPLLSPRLSAVQGPLPSPSPISQSGKSRIHDKRATSVPCTHTQVCARDNRSVTCPRCLMQRPVLNRHRQGKQCNQAIPRVHGDTTSYTHQYPNHIPSRSPFFLSTIFIYSK